MCGLLRNGVRIVGEDSIYQGVIVGNGGPMMLKVAWDGCTYEGATVVGDDFTFIVKDVSYGCTYDGERIEGGGCTFKVEGCKNGWNF